MALTGKTIVGVFHDRQPTPGIFALLQKNRKLNMVRGSLAGQSRQTFLISFRRPAVNEKNRVDAAMLA